MSSATRIAHITAREVLDSRGRPTVEADVHLRGGVIGRASVPSGASTGRHEAAELRDGDPARYRGKGVRKAVHHVETELRPAVMGLDAADQQGLDRRLCERDGTPNKGRLGANAILAVSLAGCRAGAHALGRPLYAHIHELYAAHDPAPPPIKVPLPMVNIISGGAHAGGQLDLQDFLAMPVGAQSYTQAMEWIAE
ncbi:MAG TPA: phosphopyruvate hydratase, partial [Limnochordia bacterium]|nr:phosphopyruvate hydratase [Limnochordia bacterium]